MLYLVTGNHVFEFPPRSEVTFVTSGHWQIATGQQLFLARNVIVLSLHADETKCKRHTYGAS